MPSMPSSQHDASQHDTSRRKFIRGLAGTAVLASTVSAALPVLGEIPPHPVPDPDLNTLLLGKSTGVNEQDVRKLFLLDPKIAHLNTGSLGACPRAVVEAHSQFLREIEGNPVHLLFGPMGEDMEKVRQNAAKFLGADLDEMMLTANTTSGMNLVADALALQAGDEVLTTNQEHPGGRVCWEHQRVRRGIVIREFDLSVPAESEASLLEAFAAAITNRTKVISVSHVNTITGLRLPIAAISRLARERGIFLVVDGAQSAGMLKIDLHAMGCDAFATSGHKWLLGPKGTGLLYLRKEFQPHLSSVYLSGGLRAYTAASGTRNVPQILALGVALDFLEKIGRQRIEECVLFLASHLRRRLLEVPGVEIASPSAPQLQSAIVTLKLPDDKPIRTVAEVSQLLVERHNIVVKTVPGEHLQGRGIRVSTHFYNSEREIERLVFALREVIATK